MVTLTVNGYSVQSLSSPFVLTLPLPASASAFQSSDPGIQSINCSANATLSFPSVTKQDVDRAKFCGFDLYDDALLQVGNDAM